MDMNTITSTCLEVIFGLFLVQVLANSLLGIDIVGMLQDLWHKFINRNARNDNETDK